jgi:hypothetical protein
VLFRSYDTAGNKIAEFHNAWEYYAFHPTAAERPIQTPNGERITSPIDQSLRLLQGSHFGIHGAAFDPARAEKDSARFNVMSEGAKKILGLTETTTEVTSIPPSGNVITRVENFVANELSKIDRESYTGKSYSGIDYTAASKGYSAVDSSKVIQENLYKASDYANKIMGQNYGQASTYKVVSGAPYTPTKYVPGTTPYQPITYYPASSYVPYSQYVPYYPTTPSYLSYSSYTPSQPPYYPYNYYNPYINYPPQSPTGGAFGAGGGMPGGPGIKTNLIIIQHQLAEIGKFAFGGGQPTPHINTGDYARLSIGSISRSARIMMSGQGGASVNTGAYPRVAVSQTRQPRISFGLVPAPQPTQPIQPMGMMSMSIANTVAAVNAMMTQAYPTRKTSVGSSSGQQIGPAQLIKDISQQVKVLLG